MEERVGQTSVRAPYEYASFLHPGPACYIPRLYLPLAADHSPVALFLFPPLLPWFRLRRFPGLHVSDDVLDRVFEARRGFIDRTMLYVVVYRVHSPQPNAEFSSPPLFVSVGCGNVAISGNP